MPSNETIVPARVVAELASDIAAMAIPRLVQDMFGSPGAPE
jgi:hypothetical protein